MKQKGFTLIELVIILTIIILLGMFIIGTSENLYNRNDSSYSVGINGVTETRCINGYEFVITQRGYATQVLGADGKPKVCQ